MTYVDRASRYRTAVLDGSIPACKWVKLACERDERDHGRQDTDGFPYVFDPESAIRVCKAIEQFPHIKGPKAKQHRVGGRMAWQTVDLEDWQCWVLCTVFGWKRRDGLRRFRTGMVMVPRKNGKALALDTEIPTPTGFARMGDLRVGDTVFGADGKPTRVIAESPVMIGHQCYEVEFSTGEVIVADAGHEWVTTARVDRPGWRPSGWIQKGVGLRRARTTEEIFNTLTFGVRPDRNHSVDVAAPLELPEVDLPIHPYSLGVWLGDGHTAAGRFTSADQEIVDAISEIEGEVRRFEQRGLAASYAIGQSFRAGLPRAQTFQGRLRTLGVLGNKRIPQEYARSSYDQRLALLQGLMDTDGTVSKAGQITFVSTKRALADDVFELVASLGFKPSMTSRDAKLYGRVVGTAHQIQFWSDRPVFRLPRKLARQRAPGRSARSRTRQIVAVRPVPSVPVKCICVDSPDHLFLAGRHCIPTHNSTLLAGVGLYMLTADGESGAEVHSAATTRDQAKIVAEAGYQMANRSKPFMEYFGIVPRGPTSSRLDVPSTASSFGPLSADAGTLDGLNPHAALVDELHAHKTRHVWDVLESAMGARSQPLLWAISTAGSSIGGICYEVLSYLHKILENVHQDETFFGVEFTIDEGDAWDDPAVWRKANPNYGVSVFPDDLERASAAARQSPAAVNNFLTKRLNVWVQSESPWMNMPAWNACSNPALGWEDFLDAETYVAVDVAQSRDIAAVVAVGRRKSDGKVIVKGKYFYPEDAVEASPIAMLSGWVREGQIIATDGSVTDYGRLQDETEQMVAETKAQMACFDRALAVHLMQRLAQTLGEGSVLEVPQNVQTYDPAMKELERLVLSGQFEHDGNPVLTWMVSNVVVQRNYKDEIFPRKAGGKDSSNKIDGVAASLMGLSRLLAPSEDTTSVYDSAGLEEFLV